jgi:hypothetical protein
MLVAMGEMQAVGAAAAGEIIMDSALKEGSNPEEEVGAGQKPLLIQARPVVTGRSLFTIKTTMKSLLVFLLVSISLAGFAQSSARFAITRGVIAGGGTTFSSSARFQLASTVGQPLAAVPASARFAIRGGFWIWPAPIIFAATEIGTNFVFSFQADLGQPYTVQFVNSLSVPSWQTLTTVTGNGGVETVTNPASGSTAGFFRLIEQ